VDNAWEQEKPEARKMLVNRAESHTSGARFVGQFCAYRNAGWWKAVNFNCFHTQYHYCFHQGGECHLCLRLHKY